VRSIFGNRVFAPRNTLIAPQCGHTAVQHASVCANSLKIRSTSPTGTVRSTTSHSLKTIFVPVALDADKKTAGAVWVARQLVRNDWQPVVDMALNFPAVLPFLGEHICRPVPKDTQRRSPRSAYVCAAQHNGPW
jgi:hypothetical protein